jgi:hypothetical protein
VPRDQDSQKPNSASEVEAIEHDENKEKTWAATSHRPALSRSDSQIIGKQRNLFSQKEGVKGSAVAGAERFERKCDLRGNRPTCDMNLHVEALSDYRIGPSTKADECGFIEKSN